MGKFLKTKAHCAFMMHTHLNASENPIRAFFPFNDEMENAFHLWEEWGETASIDNSEQRRGKLSVCVGKFFHRRVAFSQFSSPTDLHSFSSHTNIFILFRRKSAEVKEAAFQHMQAFYDDCAPSQLHFWRINMKKSCFFHYRAVKRKKWKIAFVSRIEWRWKSNSIFSFYIFHASANFHNDPWRGSETFFFYVYSKWNWNGDWIIFSGGFIIKILRVFRAVLRFKIGNLFFSGVIDFEYNTIKNQY